MTVLLLTPPFTQLNTPYPATAYLKGFLNAQNIQAVQADLGIEVILRLFSMRGLTAVFDAATMSGLNLSANSLRIIRLRADYVATIEPTIRFLQHKNPTLAHAIADRAYLPEASRFADLDDLDWAFGTMGTQDKARHLATLYLEDLGDLIAEAVDPHFGFSRYAERLGRSATHFDELHSALQTETSLITSLLEEILVEKMKQHQPRLVCLTIPFPGNLYGALVCGKFLKTHFPETKIVIGGGYVNTELRALAEPRLFDYLDFVSLDDGEAPLLNLYQHLTGQHDRASLKRVFVRENGVVRYCNAATEKDIPQRDTGTPDYTDLPLGDYLSVIEVANPMHRLWSDGRWNKLTLAHGCYWGKCSFCDVTLDYIGRYEPAPASLLVDRMETIVAQTGQNGFHFVDEAAPPALMRDVALEILRRRLTVVWWTNIRFEVSFTADLCALLKASGCIAVSGGLEVASDRLLARMRKGVTVAQVARVAGHFTNAGIMVHAYLMYGFPTQTLQETIDSLEMVRQLFQNGLVQSGFWHRFAMTAHSPVGQHPAGFDVQRIGPTPGPFADNDLYHSDPTGADHDLFAEGLRKSLFNFMHGVCVELPLQTWFNFPISPTSIPPNYIADCVENEPEPAYRPNARFVWLGPAPDVSIRPARRRKPERGILHGLTRQGDWQIETAPATARWLAEWLPKLSASAGSEATRAESETRFEQAELGSFTELMTSPVWAELREAGLWEV